MFKDKRGASGLKKAIIAGGVLVGLIVLVIVIMSVFEIKFPKFGGGEVTSVQKIIGPKDNTLTGKFQNILSVFIGFVIGGVPSSMISLSTTKFGALIALVAIWGMFVLALGDILKNFGSFSKGVSWGIAILLGIAAANLKIISSFAGWSTAIFAGLGIFAIYAGLLASLVAFFIVEWGLGGEGIGDWIFRRKMLQTAAREEIKTKAGAKKVASFIKGAKEGADAFAAGP